LPRLLKCRCVARLELYRLVEVRHCPGSIAVHPVSDAARVIEFRIIGLDGDRLIEVAQRQVIILHVTIRDAAPAQGRNERRHQLQRVAIIGDCRGRVAVGAGGVGAERVGYCVVEGT